MNTLVQQIRLQDHERDTLHHALQALPALYPDIETFISETRRVIGDALPVWLRSELETFARPQTPHKALLVENVPIGSLPPTPLDARHPPSKLDAVSEGVLLGILGILGEPYAYGREKGGEIVQQACPVQGHENEQSSESSIATLLFHNENMFHGIGQMPKYFGFLCLRNNEQVVTDIANVRMAMNMLNNRSIFQQLRRPAFQARLADSFGAREETWTEGRPILFGDSENPKLCVDFADMRTIDGRAEAVFRALENAINQVRTGICLHAGELLVINNFECVHGRRSFQSNYDGNQRWLQRAYVTDNLAKHGTPQNGVRIF